MRKLLKFLSTLLFGLILTINLFAQWCTTPDYVPQTGGNQILSVYESKNGESLPTKGTIRVLIVFYEVNYDLGTDPSPTSPEWPAHSLPNWATPVNLLVDANPPNGPTQAVLTEYFRQASFGQYNVIGDYLLSPVNGGIFTIDYSEFQSPPVSLLASLCDHVNTPMAGNFVTGTGLNNVSHFDNWTKTGPGIAKISPSIDSPNKYDHVMFIWRNLVGYSGQGYADPGGINLSNILNYKADTYSFFGAHHITGEVPYLIARHEFSHLLYGANNFHCGGGGWGPDNYWVPQVSGWSNLGLYNSSIQTWNAWDRQHMDWKPTGNTYNPAARNAGNTAEVNGDLDATNPLQAGIYTLRDFVRTGDAIRIKLPFTDPATEYPEWIWIENHNGESMNGSRFDRFQYQGMSCINPEVYGLYMYMQIDKDVRQAATQNEIYSPNLHFADYLRPITADGRFDREYATQAGNPCHWGIGDWPIIRNKPNALSGNSDQDFGSYNNFPGDGILTSRDQREPYLENVAGTNIPGLLLLGDSRHAFSFTGNKKLGIATNPSSASLMNLVGYDIPLSQSNPGIKDLQKVYINGISIEILNQASTGEIQVQIKFNDVDVDKDTRWCADEIILNPIASPLGYSLNILPLKKLTIDQGKTATRMDNPQIISGREVFASQTIMRCLPNTFVHLDIGSTMILDNKSTVELQNLSKIVVEDKAMLIVRNSSTLHLLANSLIQVKRGGKLILEDKSYLQQENNSRVIIEDGGLLEYHRNADISLNGPNAVLEIAGMLNIKNNATFTFHFNNSNHGYIKLDNTSLVPSRNIFAGNNCNISLSGFSQSKKILEVDQETFYAPPGIVNFSISNGKVELAAGSRIQADGLNTAISLTNAKFTSTTPGVNNAHRGFHLYGQPSVIIDNCVFEFGSTGIYAYLTLGGSALYISNSVFRNNTRGILAYDKGVNLLNCSFTDNVYGFIGGNMSFPSSSIGGIYKSNTTGTYWHSNSSGSYTFDNPYISGNITGVKSHASPLNVKCGLVSYNKYGIVLNYGATLRMDDQVAFPNAAAVTAIGNKYTIQAWRAGNLFLNLGFNDFTPSQSLQQRTINGTLISGGPNPIIANSNKWNSSGTLTPSDYLLSDLNGNNIVINDQNPLRSIIACGQAIPACPNPPCQIMSSPLVYCPQCEIINTANFVNTKLNEASSITLSMLQSHNRPKYRRAISLFCEILNQDFPNPDERESYLINLNYLKLIETLGNAFSSNQISCNENRTSLCLEINKIVEIENKFIDQADQENNYYRKYLYSLDKAQTYRIAGRQDLCLTVLTDVLRWADIDDIEEINKLICAVELEEDVLAGRMDIGRIYDALYQCNRTYEFRTADSNDRNSITMNEPETTISVFPNPVSDIASLRTNIENAHILLYDGLGRILFSEKINYDSDIDLSSLPDGIYTLKVENLITSEYWNKKLVVQ